MPLYPESVNKDEFAEIFTICFVAMRRTHQESKLRAGTAIITNILLKNGDPDKLSYNELDHFSRCIENLSSGLVILLYSSSHSFMLNDLRTRSTRLSLMVFLDFFTNLVSARVKLIIFDNYSCDLSKKFIDRGIDSFIISLTKEFQNCQK